MSTPHDHGMQALFDFWGKAGQAALEWQQTVSGNLAGHCHVNRDWRAGAVWARMVG